MSLKAVIGDIQIRRQKNRIDSKEFMFPDALRNTKHILVLLPSGLRELTLVKQFLPMISDMFKPAEVVLLSMPGVKVTDIFPRKGFQIMSPSNEHLTWSGLAKKNYLKTLEDLKIDLILDLNLDKSTFTSSVLLNFPQAVRIGRGNHRGNPFYNLEIKTKYLRDERNIYKTLLETIETLKGQPIHN